LTGQGEDTGADHDAGPQGYRADEREAGRYCPVIIFSRNSSPPTWHLRTRTRTFADIGRCKSRRSFHHIQHGEQSFRPRSSRRRGPWSRISILSWSCSFFGCFIAIKPPPPARSAGISRLPTFLLMEDVGLPGYFVLQPLCLGSLVPVTLGFHLIFQSFHF